MEFAFTKHSSLTQANNFFFYLHEIQKTPILEGLTPSMNFFL